ncbi:uncharacterized protein BYT42DRAFT_557381 [Radiomyces spectabilis]|uniref:uncharacterized protein n=1 Tax=Radiomyces spectabilis TaxID=64574 RepID=UPI0022203CB0|nr:uncharacterized protein BYT42DRAFT_557381 [Radiomyces spectabilis]KAI8391585.1 hypothetical protein BYT42DRAFT_557381 [Radiomyces spectabilis]
MTLFIGKRNQCFSFDAFVLLVLEYSVFLSFYPKTTVMVVNYWKLKQCFKELVLSALMVAVYAASTVIYGWSLFFTLLTALLPGTKSLLKPKVVAITGASTGIGEAIAYEYAKQKVRLILIARNQNKLQTVSSKCRQLGAVDVEIASIDVSKTEDLINFFEDRTEQSPIDLFIANAGMVVETTPLIPDNKCETIVNTNILGAIAGADTVFRAMHRRRRGGQIAVVSSIYGFMGVPDVIYYDLTKAALLSYARDLRTLGKASNIHVSVICPGLILTNMTESLNVAEFFYTKPAVIASHIRKGLEANLPVIGMPWFQFVTAFVLSSLPPMLHSFARDRMLDVYNAIKPSKTYQ